MVFKHAKRQNTTCFGIEREAPLVSATTAPSSRKMNDCTTLLAAVHGKRSAGWQAPPCLDPPACENRAAPGSSCRVRCNRPTGIARCGEPRRGLTEALLGAADGIRTTRLAGDFPASGRQERPLHFGSGLRFQRYWADGMAHLKEMRQPAPAIKLRAVVDSFWRLGLEP